jgi:ABC-type nitrate/sulfonate/bicarbonate transport system substrate-binding protein
VTTSPATTTLRCRLGWLPTVEWAGLFLADADGDLARSGLDVTFVPGGPGRPGAARAIAAGDADLGVPSDLLAVLDVIAEGAPLRLLGATMGASPLGIAWPADAGTVTMARLAGRRIGAGADADQAVIDALFRVNGLEPDYTFVRIGGGTDELLTGDADAICCSTISQPPAAERRGMPLATATFAALGLPMPADVFVVHADVLAARRADVVGFLRAAAAGWQRAVDDPDRAARLSHDRHGAALGTELADAQAEHRRQLAFVRHAPDHGLPLLWIDAAELARSFTRLAAGGVAHLPAVDDVVDLAPLTEALGLDATARTTT